jgi:hypothetical protein
MIHADTSWHVALAIVLALALITGGLLALIFAVVRRCEYLPPPDFRVGRSCFSEWRDRR